MVPPVKLPAEPLCATASAVGDVRVVNKITWQRAGGVTEPGRYMFTFGWLTVTSDDLRIWNQFPDAAFTLVELPVHADDREEAEEVHAEEFHLGTFELPPPASDRPDH
jgi:hypothetical protein